METKSMSKKLLTTREQSRNKPQYLQWVFNIERNSNTGSGASISFVFSIYNLIYNFAAHQNRTNKSSNDQNTDYNQNQGK